MTFRPHTARLPSVLPLAIGLAFAPAAVPTHLASQEPPPPAIRADRLLLAAEQMLKEASKRYRWALSSLDEALRLQAEHDLDIRDAFWYRHAQVALQVGQPVKANTSALKYLELTGQVGEHHLEALDILNETEAIIGQAAWRVSRGQAIPADRQAALDHLLEQAEDNAPNRVFRDCPACPVMVEVPAGTYMMGTSVDDPEGYLGERPRHSVAIGSRFAVGVYEVTFAEWDACVEGGGCGGHGADDSGWGRGTRPVSGLSWEDARAYVSWLSERTGAAYRLLTEAEWEYVARAGTETQWYWGTSEETRCQYANAEGIKPCYDGYESETAPVGLFEPNAFGLYDVVGNVWEWTEDCWKKDYSGAPADGSAWQSGDCSHRVMRGGAWNLHSGYLRSAARGWSLAGVRGGNKGFRVARTIN